MNKATYTNTSIAFLITIIFGLTSTMDAQNRGGDILDDFQDDHQSGMVSSQKSIQTDHSGSVPQGFNFQAVARDASGEPLINQELGVEVSVLQGSESGQAVYTETHVVMTDASGLMQIVIGEGDSGDNFSAIDWSADNYYVNLAIDPSGGTTYEQLGATRLLSVPYALVAKNVIEGVSVGETPITMYNLNTAEGDTSFIINSTGTEGLTTLRVNSATDGFNYAVSGDAISESNNENAQRGVQGIASGLGTGIHFGVFGSAVNPEAMGGSRRGVHGQAVSKSRFNWGVYGISQGQGDGTIVPIGEEGDDGAGSFNIGGGFYSSGNINGNLGVEGVVTGSAGTRINIGVEGRVTATANAPNFGLNGRAFNSPIENIGVTGHAEGPEGSFNVAVRGTTGGAGDILAGLFQGTVQVDGDINYTGELSQTSDRNLKENIRPLKNGLSTILKLNPTTYNFRGNGEVNGLPLTTRSHFGLIAQEVEEVLPGLVKVNRHRYKEEAEVQTGPDTPETELVDKIMEYKTLNYTELIPVLIKAIQEQQEEINQLKDELKKLKN